MANNFLSGLIVLLWIPYLCASAFIGQIDSGAGSLTVKLVRGDTLEPIAKGEIALIEMPDLKVALSIPQFRGLIDRGLTFEEAVQFTMQGSPLPVGSLSGETDESGTLVLSSVPSRTYLVLGQRGGYYVRARTGFPIALATATVTIRPNQVSGVQLKLYPSAAIGGRVLDRNGNPIVDAQVQVYQLAYMNGASTITPVSTGSITPKRSNDRGEYRLYQIPPGTYYVVATPNRISIAPPLIPPNSVRQSSRRSLVPTFYPDSIDITTAIPITLKGGEDLAGVDIRLGDPQVGKVIGRVVSTLPKRPVLTQGGDIRQPAASLTLVRRGNSSIARFRASAVADPTDGTFEFSDVPFGSYELYARLPADKGWGEAAVPSSAKLPWAFGHTSIDVKEEEVNNVTITVQQGVDIRGRILINGLPSAANIGISLVPMPTDGIDTVALNLFSQIKRFRPTIETDGSFVIPLVPPAQYQIQVELRSNSREPKDNLPPNTYVEDIRNGGISVYESGLEVTSSEIDSLEISINTNGGSIGGTLQVPDGKAAARFLVVLIPAGGKNPAMYKTTLSDDVGLFAFSAIPPGRYKLFAWDTDLNVMYMDPSVIEDYGQKGKEVLVSPGTRVVADVNLITEPVVR